jgi:cation transport ATPase
VSRFNPTLRGFAIILLIAVVITVLNLQTALNSLILLAQIAFFLAIAFFLYLLWRDRREEISAWGARSRAVFYGAVVLAVVNVAASIVPAASYPEGGLETLVFVAVLVACGYSLWRTWRREHTYGY